MADKNRNTGGWNTGNSNAGDRNTGDGNTGYRNTGNRNTGGWNTGYGNAGDWNTGYRNTGYRNTGDWNTGNRNTGDWNTGYGNAGDWNTGDRNTGDFNTKTPDGGYYFDKWLTTKEWAAADKPDCIYEPSPTTWVSDTVMSDQEKTDNPTFHTCGGYLRVNDMLEEWQKAFVGASQEDIQKVRDLPNFSAEVFKEITGVDLSTDTNCEGEIITVKGVDYRLVRET